MRAKVFELPFNSNKRVKKLKEDQNSSFYRLFEPS